MDAFRLFFFQLVAVQDRGSRLFGGKFKMKQYTMSRVEFPGIHQVCDVTLSTTPEVETFLVGI